MRRGEYAITTNIYFHFFLLPIQNVIEPRTNQIIFGLVPKNTALNIANTGITSNRPAHI